MSIFSDEGKPTRSFWKSAGRNDLATKSDVYRHISELEADGGAWRSLFERHALPLFGAAYSQLGLEEADWSRLFFNAMFLVTAVWVLLDRGPELGGRSLERLAHISRGGHPARALFRSPSVDATFVASLPEDVRKALAAGSSRCSVDLKEIGASFGQLEFLGRLGSESWDRHPSASISTSS